MVDYEFAAKRAFQDPKTFIICVILSCLSLFTLFITGLVVFDLYLKTMRSSMQGKKKMPKFSGVIQPVLNGLRLYFVFILYYLSFWFLLIIPLILASTLIGVYKIFPSSAIAILPLAIASFLLLSALVIVVFWFLSIPSALMEFVKDDKVLSVLHLKTIFKRALDLHYAQTVILGSVIMFLGLLPPLLFILLILQISESIGILFLFPVIFAYGIWGSVFIFTVFGELYTELEKPWRVRRKAKN